MQTGVNTLPSGSESRGLLNHLRRDRRFGNANARARHHVSIMCAGNIDLILAVEAVWMVATNIEIYSAGACDGTDDCKVPAPLRR